MVLRIFTKEIQIKIKRIICKKIGLTARKESGVMNVNRQKWPRIIGILTKDTKTTKLSPLSKLHKAGNGSLNSNF